MRKSIAPFLLFFLLLTACSNDKHEGPATALDTGREFIRASLNGEFMEAEKLVLTDTLNQQLFDSYKAYYERLSPGKKKHYKDADYAINKYVDVNDSTTIINYSNDYMNKPMDIKVVRENKQWKVDFKYTYSGNLPIE